MNYPSTTETAKTTIARLTAWRDSKIGRFVYINWRWSGRDRSGVVALVENGSVVLESVFHRGSMKWTDQDRDFSSCYTGSFKHQALLDVANGINA